MTFLIPGVYWVMRCRIESREANKETIALVTMRDNGPLASGSSSGSRDK